MSVTTVTRPNRRGAVRAVPGSRTVPGQAAGARGAYAAKAVRRCGG